MSFIGFYTSFIVMTCVTFISGSHTNRNFPHLCHIINKINFRKIQTNIRSDLTLLRYGDLF